jgi:hypothetical protein
LSSLILPLINSLDDTTALIKAGIGIGIVGNRSIYCKRCW